MSKHILFIVFIVISVKGYSQNKVENMVNAIPNIALDTKSIAPIKKLPCSIEINPFFRYDAYSEFLSEVRETDRIYVTPRGYSFGLNVNYKKPLNKNYNLSVGLGYYKNTFDKVKSRNKRGENDNRQIGIPTLAFIYYFTDRYLYNTVTLNIGLERVFLIRQNYLITLGTMLQNNFTFSQYYHLTNNPMGSLDYKRKASRYNGFSALVCAGLQRRAGNFALGPQLILPVYDRLSTDEVFPKETSEGNPPSKWFRGIGLGFTCNYLLTKKS